MNSFASCVILLNGILCFLKIEGAMIDILCLMKASHFLCCSLKVSKNNAISKEHYAVKNILLFNRASILWPYLGGTQYQDFGSPVCK